jgi:very-short-patch-repair endonuclease
MSPKNVVIGQKVTQEKISRAKELRRELTPAERKLWTRLRANRLAGFHFRRQQIIEPYIVDFYCHQVALIIEVDGDIHAGQEAYDRTRAQELQKRGFRVIRFTNHEVMNDLDGVLGKIYQVCQEQMCKQLDDELP